MDDGGQMAHGVANERTQRGEEGENWQIPCTVGSGFDKGVWVEGIMGGGSKEGEAVQNSQL